MSENRKLTLDARMLDDKKFSRFDSEKMMQVVDNVYQIWETSKNQKATQMIFSDLGVPLQYKNNPALNLDKSPNYFSAYDEIKTLLVERGVPEKEVRFIHEATDKTKEQMMKDMRSGQIRILLASTSKGGTGLNVQDKLLAVHHLDVPWRPSDITQRNGRIIRQGNEHDSVQIHHYLTKGTLDSFMWQTQAQKSKLIEQVMKGDPTIREMTELDHLSATASEFQAIAASNPYALKLLQTQQELSMLKNSRKRFYEAKLTDHRRLTQHKKDLPQLEKRRLAITKDIETLSAHPSPQAPVKLYLKDRTKDFIFDDKHTRTTLGEQLLSLIRQNLSDDKRVTQLATYRGFEICHKTVTSNQDLNTGTHLILRGQTDYIVPIDLKSPMGIVTRIDNQLERLDKVYQACKEDLTLYKETITYLEKIQADTFPKETDYRNKIQEVDQLQELMMANEASQTSDKSDDLDDEFTM
jgi:SNF2 family DNA or RNA helicase